MSRIRQLARSKDLGLFASMVTHPNLKQQLIEPVLLAGDGHFLVVAAPSLKTEHLHTPPGVHVKASLFGTSELEAGADAAGGH